MEFRCEDLPQHGVVLIPPASSEYDPLLADIQHRLDHPVAGSPPPLPEPMRPRISQEDRALSAILLNRSQRAIASIQQVWTFEDAAGRKSGGSSIGAGWNPSVLLPFGLPERTLKLYGYWHVILPGSKRYLNANGEQAGDNSDVRPPVGDEVWSGGISGGRSGGGRRSTPVDKVTLTLDGVFFADGGFAGPNRNRLWEQVVHSAEVHTQAATIARQGHYAGVPAAKILARIADLTGPPPERPPMFRRLTNETDPGSYRTAALGMLASKLDGFRKYQGDDPTVIMLLSWNDAKLPHFHKL